MDREGIISKGSRSKKIESLLSTQAKAANLAAEQRWVGATTQLVDDLLAIPCPGEENLLPPPPSPPRPFKFDASQTEHELTRLLISTARQHAAAGEHNKSACLGLFRGDIAEALATAAERGALTSELVSLAPLAGHDVWSAASRLLAKQAAFPFLLLLPDSQQLEAQQLPHQAVAHLLACNQVEDAVAVYRRAGMYRDAIALARCRFSSSQLVLQQLWSDWAQALQAAHRPIYAAQCFLRAGRASEAIAVLEQGGGPRGSEPSMLLAAHKLSEKFGARSEARTLRCAGLLWEVGMLEEAGEVSCSLAGCSSLRLLVALELRVMPQPLAELSVLHRLRLLLPHPSDQLVRLAEGGWGGSGCEEENNGVLAGILLEAATSLDGGEGEEGRNRRERAERLLEDVQRGEWVRSLRGGMEEILTRRQQARAARSFLLAVLLGFCGKREKAGQELAVALSQLFALKDYMAAAELAVALLPDDCGGLERMGGEEEEGDAKPMREREGREGKVLQVLQAFRWFGEVYMACNGTGRKEVGKERQRLDRLQEMRAKLVGTSRHNQVEQALSSLPSVVTWLLPPPRCISFSDPESIIQAPAPSICSQLLADLDQLNVEERTLQ
ncbi:hypothetical protein GUITHDRAFT_142391 [Guillardia theta CCMP2712]|uniref:Gem-associated protein 5 TPR domain-containing protein n=1 Tax=Guillardia theta (strain CCMP2712) TaxID=905079 RepID=L1IXP1_GUITC|nr:hypothetical protein GUITHDRAFT_142391 [Guillardia theta CCMP2712]EKX41001.1 hypothetical protein GUITHDRAFT_142391 [Guillardia theta CCMP2712]|eukprot:XP_005827981.1 hypothetical protein GUITHDRAFT_142391 [Guillardia theta CCMP2712]